MSINWKIACAISWRHGRRWAIGALVALSLACTLFYRFAASRYTIPDATGLIAWLWVLLLPAVQFLIVRVIRPRLVACRRRSVVAAVVVALLAGAVLSRAIPLPPPLSGRLHQLEVIASGRKDEPSRRAPVCIGSLDLGDSPFVAPEEFQHDGKWTLREGRDYLVTERTNDPARLRWEGMLPATANGPLQLRLVAGRGMGIVEIVWDGRSRVVDLDEEAPPGGAIKRVALHVPGPPRAARWFHAACGVVSISFVLFLSVAVIGLARPAPPVGRPLPRRWLILAHAAPMLGVWTFYVLAHWPAMVSHDSVGDWFAATFHLWYDKPAMQQFTIWAITRFWFSPGAVILTYAAVFTLLLGWIIVRFRSIGLSATQAWAISIFLAIFPMHARVVSWLLNDTPFTIAMLAVSAILLEIVESRGEWLNARGGNWIALAVACALTALYRHTGLLAVLATYALLVLRYRRSLRPVLLSLTLCALLVGVVRGPVYRALDVKPFGMNMKRMLVGSLFVWPIMAHVHQGTAVSDRDAQVLREWDPNRTGFWNHYGPERQWNPCWLDTFPRDRLDQFDSRIIRVWANLTRRAPAVTLDHYLEVSSFVWGIDTGRIITWSFMDKDHLLRDHLPSPYTTTDASLVPFGPGWGRALVNAMDRHAWFFWRPALWFYLLLFAYAIGILRDGRWDGLIIVAPQVANAVIIAVSANTPEVRYVYPLLVSSQLFALFFAMKRSGHAASPERRTTATSRTPAWLRRPSFQPEWDSSLR
jgi:hypothetical protein